MILGSGSNIRDEGEGNEGGRGGDEPTSLESKPSYSKEDEEEKEEEDMVDKNLEWMIHGPLALSGALHRKPKH